MIITGDLLNVSRHRYYGMDWQLHLTVCLRMYLPIHAITLILFHDDVIKWKHFPRYWPYVRGIHRWPVNSPHKGQWREALMFSLICAWISRWVNNREAGDLRRHRTHYDANVMLFLLSKVVTGNSKSIKNIAREKCTPILAPNEHILNTFWTDWHALKHFQ